ncbi:MAG TPA: hypothetical protein VL691_16190 [Vicinamibacteria bacterium]|nr:hypothetical protein [Vicinamibacteria bacterium]
MTTPGDGETDLRQIPTWTRRYARNRTLAMAGMLAVFLLAFSALTGLALGSGWLFRHGHRPLGGAGVVVLLGLTLWWVWFSAVGVRRLAVWLQGRLYAAEGDVRPEEEESRALARAGWWVGLSFVACVSATVVLVGTGLVPLKYMQPVSALYVVPFLMCLTLLQPRSVSPFLWLWPALYATHAALILGGAPILLAEPLESLNVVIPTVGYGLLAALLGHAYSRYALWRLRRLTRGAEEASR